MTNILAVVEYTSYAIPGNKTANFYNWVYNFFIFMMSSLTGFTTPL